MSEKELYSKICVAESINHVVGEASNEVVDMKDPYRFSNNLATILARDREVVAVRLKISDDCKVYISKNSDWSEEDVKYIHNILGYLKFISNEPLVTEYVEGLTAEVLEYCFNKIGYRFEKLERDIIRDSQKEHIKSFIEYAKDRFKEFDPDKLGDVNLSKISATCSSYYIKVKKSQKETSENPVIPEKFLGHVKKVGSYARALMDMVACARNVKYKDLFSNIKLRIVKPIIGDQLLYSWGDIIKRFARNHIDYETFRAECLKNSHIAEKLRKIYADENTQQLQLEVKTIKQRVCLHAEMNILANIIDQGDKSKAYIAVSKRCCFLCELYINFARNKGYNIIVAGHHKKIYRDWKLPLVLDANFKIGSLKYILEELDQIIEDKVKLYTGSFKAVSDSEACTDRTDDLSEVGDIKIDSFMMNYNFNR